MSDPLTYKKAGVDIDAGNEAVNRIKKLISSRPRHVTGGEELGGIGGFSAFFRPFLHSYREPILVSSTDGVGTKLLIALETQKLGTIGQDLVAMCVNDIVVTGARPLFFLDYLATGKLDPAQVETIVRSIQEACEESDCLLVGGECAEMPGMYAPEHTDLAGFGVGIVEREKIIDGSNVEAGDIVLGLASSGLHSNGYSLVRKVIEKSGLGLSDNLPGTDIMLCDAVLKPTKLYVKPLLALYSALGTGKDGAVKACAHITGGGILENLARVIPNGLAAELKRESWVEPEVYRWIRKETDLPDSEMDRTFNRGVGCAVIISGTKLDEAKSLLTGLGETVYNIGIIVGRLPDDPKVIII